jgi:hypothetical protein
MEKESRRELYIRMEMGLFWRGVHGVFSGLWWEERRFGTDVMISRDWE